MNWLIEGLIFIGLGILAICIVAKACECFGEDK
jgi:hypothetical protein